MRCRAKTWRLAVVALCMALNLGLPLAVGQTVTNYIRGDGSGDDSHGGSSWGDAWATLQKGLDSVSADTPAVINVQATTGTQFHAACTRSDGGFNDGKDHPVNVLFLGGWQSVDTTPVQSGITLVKDASASKPGFQWLGPTSYHYLPRTVLLDRFVFSNVTHGIEFTVNSGSDHSDVILALNNVTIRAKNYGVYLEYAKSYAWNSWGGYCQVKAENVDIVAGLGGAGDGIYSKGAWLGSRITATGTNAATGDPRVSTVTSRNGCGVRLEAINFGGTFTFGVTNTVIHGCSSNAVRLEALIYSAQGSGTRLQSSFRNCTVVDNAGDGLVMVCSNGAVNYASITNCIFAGNGVHGVSLGTSGGPAFTCPEAYNVFYNDDIYINGAAQTCAGSDAMTDPLFIARGDKPDPFYSIKFTASPCFRSGDDTSNRGAFQNMPGCKGTLVIFR